MPKISAATVREHHANIRAALIDAAERIVRVDGTRALTAGAVAQAAGISRNSIYRYVESVDDLRGLVLDRHLPAWTGAVAKELSGVTDPSQRILVWCRAHLIQASSAGHGWLMELARSGALRGTTRAAVEHAHDSIDGDLMVDWLQVCPDRRRAEVNVELTRTIIDGGFRLLDRAVPIDLVIEQVLCSVGALVSAAEGSGCDDG